MLQGVVNGIGHNPSLNWTVRGTVTGDGSFTGFNGAQALTGKFQGTAFYGTYLSSVAQCGRRSLTLQRAGNTR